MAPDGYDVPAHKIWKLHRSLYALKQVEKEQINCFIQSQHDYYLFVKNVNVDFLPILVYVDDLLIMGQNLSLISDVKTYLYNAFTIKEIGHVLRS